MKKWYDFDFRYRNEKNLTNEKEILNINKVIDNFDLYIVRVNKKSKDTLMKLIIVSTD